MLCYSEKFHVMKMYLNNDIAEESIISIFLEDQIIKNMHFSISKVAIIKFLLTKS